MSSRRFWALFALPLASILSDISRPFSAFSHVITLVMTSPDVYRAAVSKNVSWAQVSKKLVVNASGVAGGIAGAAGGAALGTMILPGPGTAIGASVGG